jgi:hypothetical protein
MTMTSFERKLQIIERHPEFAARLLREEAEEGPGRDADREAVRADARRNGPVISEIADTALRGQTSTSKRGRA